MRALAGEMDGLWMDGVKLACVTLFSLTCQAVVIHTLPFHHFVLLPICSHPFSRPAISSLSLLDTVTAELLIISCMLHSFSISGSKIPPYCHCVCVCVYYLCLLYTFIHMCVMYNVTKIYVNMSHAHTPIIYPTLPLIHDKQTGMSLRLCHLARERQKHTYEDTSLIKAPA